MALKSLDSKGWKTEWLVIIKWHIYGLEKGLNTVVCMCFWELWYLWEISCFAACGQPNTQCFQSKTGHFQILFHSHPIPLFGFFFLGDRSSVIKNIISFLGKIFEPGLSLGSFFLNPKSHESSQWLLENVILEILLVCSGKQCCFQPVLIKGCALRRKAAYHICSMTGVHAACPCFKAFKCFRAK